MPVHFFLLPQVAFDSVVEVPFCRTNIDVVTFSESIFTQFANLDCSCIFEMYIQEICSIHCLIFFSQLPSLS